MAKARPGVMLYFDIMVAMKRLKKEQKGDLFDAIMYYGRDGIEPDFHSDPFLQFAWDLIRPRVDADGISYQEKTNEGKYGAYKKKALNLGVAPISYATWCELDEQERKMLLP